MKYCNIRFDQNELDIIKNSIKSQYLTKQQQLETIDNSIDKDNITEAMLKLQAITDKLDKAILWKDGEVD